MGLVCVLVLQVVLAAASASVIFEDCGSAYELQTVSIEGCDMRLPCYVTSGEDVPVDLEFHAGFTSNNLDQNVVININHLNLPTAVTPERCEVNDCPVKPGRISSYTSIMSVPDSIALNQRGYLRWRVINEAGKQVLCYSVLVQTQSPLQKHLRQFLGIVPTYNKK